MGEYPDVSEQGKADQSDRDKGGYPVVAAFNDPFESLETRVEARELGLDQALTLLVEHIKETTLASGAVVALGTAQSMICRASVGIAPEVGARLDPDSGLSGECIRTGKLIHCRDTETDKRVDPAVCRDLDLRSLVIWPLFHNSKIAGVMEVFSPEADSFSDSDLTLLDAAGKSTIRLSNIATKALTSDVLLKRTVGPDYPRTVETKAVEAKSAETKSLEAKVSEPKSVESKIFESKLVEPNLVEPRAPKVTKSRGSDSVTAKESNKRSPLSLDLSSFSGEATETSKSSDALSGDTSTEEIGSIESLSKPFWSDWNFKRRLGLIGGIIAVLLGILASIAWHRMAMTPDVQQTAPASSPSSSLVLPPLPSEPVASASAETGTASLKEKKKRKAHSKRNQAESAQKKKKLEFFS